MIEPEVKKLPELSECTFPPAFIKFASRSEFALSEIFKKYIPGWFPEMGTTFQIPILDKRIDFQINKTLIEFHPIVITRELKSSNASAIFRQMFRRADKWERGQLTEMLVEELASQYSARRWQLIQHSEHRGKGLVVCCTERQIYKKVIQRFAPEPPKFKQFLQEFNAHVKDCKL